MDRTSAARIPTVTENVLTQLNCELLLDKLDTNIYFAGFNFRYASHVDSHDDRRFSSSPSLDLV